MRNPLVLTALSALLLTACPKSTENAPAAASSEAPLTTNSLLTPWTGPFGGVPPFDKVVVTDLKAALEEAMALRVAEIEAIATNPELPTFENTIVAMDRGGRDLARVKTLYDVWGSSRADDAYRAVQLEMAPKLAAHKTEITQNAALFSRIKAVYESEDHDSLRPDQQRLTKLTYDRFARSGAHLEGEQKERYAEISERLAELQTRFGNNVLSDEEDIVHYLSEDQLGGLSESLVSAAARAATERGHDGEFAITNTRSSMDPFLTFSTERALREQVWRAYYNRGDNGDENDNNKVIAEIVTLRNERSKLLGHDNFATWKLENRMAKTPERALELMETVWPSAIARVAEEVAAMQALADEEGADISIAPWDYRHYAEKVRKDKYDLDSEKVREYLVLSNLQEAMFFVAGELFGFAFQPVPAGSVPVFHESMGVWEVTDKGTGAHIGLWYLDPYSRPGKHSGAWAATYRKYRTLDGKETVLAANNSNFVAGAPGEPVLISWDDAETLFHEFGHALFYLSSRANYPGLTGGVGDYTEFQSQLLEHWLSTEPVIEKYLVHYQTGEPIPADLMAKIKKAATFNSGFETTEYLASALVDMRFHTADPSDLDVDGFEREALETLKMPDEVVMRHRSPHFGHVFSEEGYAAGYYGYMWADVLTSDAAQAFADAPGGYYDKELAAKLVEHLFQAQNSVPPEEAYRAFRGRDAELEPFLRDSGFSTPSKD